MNSSIASTAAHTVAGLRHSSLKRSPAGVARYAIGSCPEASATLSSSTTCGTVFGGVRGMMSPVRPSRISFRNAPGSNKHESSTAWSLGEASARMRPLAPDVKKDIISGMRRYGAVRYVISSSASRCPSVPSCQSSGMVWMTVQEKK